MGGGNLEEKLFKMSTAVKKNPGSAPANVPLDETIKISVKKLLGRKKKLHGFSRQQFKKLIFLAAKNIFFLLNYAYYVQVDGVAMGSPLGPTLANIFLCHWEEIWLDKCLQQFKPKFYNRVMDDTFLLFSSQDHVKKFTNTLAHAIRT